MITIELLSKIRRMHVRDKMSVRAIAKRTGLSRNTLQKWLATSVEVAAPKYIRAKTFGNPLVDVSSYPATHITRLAQWRESTD